jgi:Tfp pilus assembly protein PilF
MPRMLENALRHHQTGRLTEAERICRQILTVDARHADSLHLLGLIACQCGRYDTAVEMIGQAIRLWKHNPFSNCTMGGDLTAQAGTDDSVAQYERAFVLKPDYADAQNNLGVALFAQGRIHDAVTHYERALGLNPNHASAHNNLGAALTEQGKIDKAVWHHERALAINPGHAEAHNRLGNIFKDQGKVDDAMERYRRTIAIRPDHAEAHYNLAETKVFRKGDPDLAALEALAGRDNLSANKAPSIHFALAKALEDIGDCVRALEHLHKGNALKRRQIDYDEKSVGELFQRIRNVFDSGLFDRFQGEGDPSSVPVFVLGMPRSGSTLIEQILASHPQIHGAGELNDLDAAVTSVLGAGGQRTRYPDCVPSLDGATLRRIGQAYLSHLLSRADGKARIVDKLPGNFVNIGLIRLILPNAKIIHTVRHPIDTCVSCYSKLFTSGQSFSYDLAELGRYYRSYKDLMTHWRSVLPSDAMLDVFYENVVDDLEGQARRMIDYCGLPWDDRCLSFDKTGRTVKTASAIQVRKPLFRSSLQRWRKCEAGIGPLLNELGELPADAPVQARHTMAAHAGS